MTRPLTVRALEEAGRMLAFGWQMARHVFTRPPQWDAVLEQMYSIGVRSLGVLSVVGLFIGSNTALQGYTAFTPLGATSLVGMFVSLAGVRELAPIIAASLITAKVGTEITTTLAVMRIRSQIDAIEVMGISPYWYLISPRLVAIGIMLPALIVLANFLCFASGYMVAVHQLHIDPGAFMDNALAYVGFRDLLIGGVKGGIFGICICTISCYYGFFAEGGAAGVGRAANHSVVVSAITVMCANFLLSEVFYG